MRHTTAPLPYPTLNTDSQHRRTRSNHRCWPAGYNPANPATPGSSETPGTSETSETPKNTTQKYLIAETIDTYSALVKHPFTPSTETLTINGIHYTPDHYTYIPHNDTLAKGITLKNNLFPLDIIDDIALRSSAVDTSSTLLIPIPKNQIRYTTTQGTDIIYSTVNKPAGLLTQDGNNTVLLIDRTGSRNGYCYFTLRHPNSSSTPTLDYLNGAVFYGYRSLRTIHLPDVSEIGSACFYNCTNLQEIRVERTKPSSYISFGPNSLANCPNLKRLILHGVPDSRSKNAFQNLPDSLQIYVPEQYVQMIKSDQTFQRYTILPLEQLQQN